MEIMRRNWPQSRIIVNLSHVAVSAEIGTF